METVLGVKWNIATDFEILFIIILFFVLGSIFVTLKILQIKKDKLINNQQLFLFRMKRMGLSNFQIKILTNMVSILHIQNNTELLDNHQLFEKAVGKFLHFLRLQNESEKSIESICHDIVIIYEKCYSQTLYKKPLESPLNLDTGQLIYFKADKQVYLGKIKGIEKTNIIIELFRTPQELKSLIKDAIAHVFIWRIGDAQYSFVSIIKDVGGRIASIAVPEEINRDRELRHPYVDIIIPVKITKAHPGVSEDNSPINSTLYKLNDYEIIFRVNSTLDYSKEIVLEFKLFDIELSVECKIIADHIIHDEKIIYYTAKFISLTEVQSKIIKQYMAEHL